MLKEPVKSGEPPLFSEVQGGRVPPASPWIRAQRCARIVNCPYCKVEVSQLKLPEHIARLGMGTGWDVEVRNPGKMGGLWWLMDDLQMIYG